MSVFSTLTGNTAHFTDIQASVRAGNDKTQFILGGGFHREGTVFPGDFADLRSSLHLSIDHHPKNSRFRMSLTSNFVSDDNHLPSTDLSPSLTLPPDAPSVFDSAGRLNWIGNFANPYQNVLQPYQNLTTLLMSSLPLSYDLLPGLQLKVSLGYSQIWTDESLIKPIRSFNPALGNPTGSVQMNTTNTNNWIIEPQLSYKKKVWKGDLEALAGGTIQENNLRLKEISASGFTNDNLLGMLMDAPVIIVTTNKVLYHYDALFGRFRYNLLDRYIFSISARRDGSSRFAPGRQFGDFGAVGAGWIFSDTRTMRRRLPWLSFGKLRLTYGSTGNDQIGDYQYYSTYRSTTISYGGVTGLMPAQLYNPDFSWEITRKWEGGLDLGLFQDRLVLTASYYRNRSSNQLVGIPLSSVTGFSTVEANFPALVQNTGWEFEVNMTLRKTEKFSWASAINLTIPRNKLLSFPMIEKTAFASIYIVGQPLTILKGFKFDGVNSATGAYQFLSGSGKAISAPQTPADNIYTWFRGQYAYGGLSNNIRYKRWQVNILFQFIAQSGNSNLYQGLPGTEANQPLTVLTRWQRPGNITDIQRFNQNYSLYNAAITARANSDHGIGDASFIRLKNISIGYTLPDQMMRKGHLEEGRIYLQAQNLITLTRFQGADPENQNAALPPLREIVAGLQITF